MNYYYITGTSKGIGKAVAEELLNDADNFVIGISRSQTIDRPNYKHVPIDLSELASVSNFRFEDHENAKKIILINNAGVISQIKRVGTLAADKIILEYNVNLVAPSLLTNSFIKTYKNNSAEKVILNISSGAGKSPIDAWSTYCASKAGLDMFSKVISEEQKISLMGFKVFSVSPGVVDTFMQETIRSSDQNDFSRRDDFVNYHETSQLASPNLVAKKIIYILANQNKFKETLLSVKDI